MIATSDFLHFRPSRGAYKPAPHTDTGQGLPLVCNRFSVPPYSRSTWLPPESGAQEMIGAPEENVFPEVNSYGVPEESGAPEKESEAQEDSFSPAESGDPEEKCGVPEEKCDAPEEKCGAPEEKCGAPEEKYGAPEEKCGALNEKYGAPEEKCGAPEEKCGAPEEKCGAPEEKCSAPEEKCGVPEEKCGAPEEKCGAPEVKCGAPEDWGARDEEMLPLYAGTSFSDVRRGESQAEPAHHAIKKTSSKGCVSREDLRKFTPFDDERQNPDSDNIDDPKNRIHGTDHDSSVDYRTRLNSQTETFCETQVNTQSNRAEIEEILFETDADSTHTVIYQSYTESELAYVQESQLETDKVSDAILETQTSAEPKITK
jgi:hypothetical protein